MKQQSFHELPFMLWSFIVVSSCVDDISLFSREPFIVVQFVQVSSRFEAVTSAFDVNVALYLH